MTVTNETILTSPRMGGEVRRYHTWPTLRQQTVMDHTGNVIRIYWQVFGRVSPEVCAYLVFHDLPEVKIGDLPHPVKARNPALKVECDRIEDEALVGMIGADAARSVLTDVTDLERVRMKACDLLEMAEFAAIERAMGNALAEPIMTNIQNGLAALELSSTDRGAVRQYMRVEIGRWI